jgi:methylmalonyl-CoA/ethylmalonyl-CoA epimerase
MSIFRRLDHVSIGVIDKDKARDLFINVFGATPLRDIGSNDQEAFTWQTFLLGGKKVEIVSPHKVGEGGVGRFIARHGEGIHHITIAVDNLEEAAAHFEKHGLRVLAKNTDDPNWKHFYLHPNDTFGALFQVFEENEHTKSLAQ